MSKVEVSGLSVEFTSDDSGGFSGHKLTFTADPLSRWGFSLYSMTPSGPSMVLGIPSLELDGDGVAHTRLMHHFADGLYVGVAERREVGTVSSETIPQPIGATPSLASPDAGVPLWVGKDAPADLHSAVKSAADEQVAFRNKEYRAEGYEGDERRILHVLVEGCILDYKQVFEGGYLTPLDHRLGAESLIHAINKMLPEGTAFPVSGPINAGYENAHPLCLATFVNVRGGSVSECAQAVQARLTRVLNALAEDRTATPQPIAYLSEAGGQFQLVTPNKVYRGNLISGFGPGVTGLLDLFDNAIAKEPWVGFALSMMRSIRMQTAVEVQLFQSWSLIEAAAKRVVPSDASIVIVDAQGKEVPGRYGKALNQSHDLGRVIIYLRDRARMQVFRPITDGSPQLYDTIKLIYQCRNQIAHGGGIGAPGSRPIVGYDDDLVRQAVDLAASVVQFEARQAVSSSS